LRCADAKKMS